MNDSGSQTLPAGRLVLVLVAALVIVIALPAVIQGSPVWDDYKRCLASDGGLPALLQQEVDNTGVVRPIRFPVITFIAAACGQVPFGFLIAVPLVLTIAAAFLLVSLLRDLDLVEPWPEIGGALFLLYPLGAESALWPSAMHIPLGLCFAIVALRAYRRGLFLVAAVTGLGASLCIEQAIFALPLAAWLVVTPTNRRRALAYGAVVAVAVVAAYAIWPGAVPGEDSRTAIAVTERIENVVKDPSFFVTFPGTSLGLRSMPLAVAWSFPLSLAALLIGALGGRRLGPSLLSAPAARLRSRWRFLVGSVLLLGLINLPLIVTVPREDSPRVFTPTWLALAGLAALLGSTVRWRRPQLAGVAFGVIGTAALLSLAFSVSVRVRTAESTTASLEWIGREVPDGGVVAVCDVRRTAIEPAPVGAYATHEFLFDWIAEPALEYRTGVRASFRLGGIYWDDRCPPGTHQADLVVTFDELLAISDQDA